MSQMDSLHNDRRRASSFGDDAEQYDRVRPPYPETMIDLLLAEGPHSVLDVGCGTGIASRLFARRGCEVLGIEPDSRMATVARRNGVTVEEGSFEEWNPRDRCFDLLVAGQAWHWVDPHIGAMKAADVLRAGGRIGLFWNQAFPADELSDAMGKAYAIHAPELGENSVLVGRRSAALYSSIADAALGTDRFDGVKVELFNHGVTYTTAQWLELATTHSDHRTLPPEVLARLLAELQREIDAVGGQVEVRYETTLVTGRTRSR